MFIIGDTKKIEIILRLTEKKFGRGGRRNWKNADYKKLKIEIRKESSISISEATLKRIFGKNKTNPSYYPQSATIDALAKYSSYDQHNKWTLRNFFFRKKKLLIYTLILLLIGILGIFIILTKKEDKVSGNLDLIKLEGLGSPATAFFNYEVTGSKKSPVIDYDDSKSTEILNSSSGYISHYYRYPGLFNPKLILNGEELKTSKTFVQTNGWQALGSYFQQNNNDRFFPIDIQFSSKDGVFHPTKEHISSVGMDTTKNVLIRLDNYFRTYVNGDNFIFDALLKGSKKWSPNRCHPILIKIVGSNGIISFRFVKNGCSKWAEFEIGEISSADYTPKLANLCVDTQNWLRIRIENNLKSISLFANDKNILNKTYEKTIGEIYGTTLEFHGDGYVDFLQLRNKDSVIIRTPVVGDSAARKNGIAR